MSVATLGKQWLIHFRTVRSKDYKKKRAEFGRLGIDELVHLLASEDLQTRFFAEMALRDATST